MNETDALTSTPAINSDNPFGQKIDVLDHGFVTLEGALGNDLTVVNAARVSFGKRKFELSEADIKLIYYLAKHRHWSPFRHIQLQFHCKVPEFVARQWYKHVVGIAYSENREIDHAWNEISLRYVNASEFDTYTPIVFRAQSADNKQASTDEAVSLPELMSAYQTHMRQALALYQALAEAGVAKEQARGVLPLSVYTEFYWTASLQAVINFIKLRQHEGAQYEIREYANAVMRLTRLVVPVATDALFG